MDEILAANNRDFASPEGAANMGEGAPLPAAQALAEPVAATADTANQEAGASAAAESGAGREWTRKVAQRIKEERQKAKDELITELFGNEEGCREFRESRERAQASRADMEEASMFAELALAADSELGAHYLALEDEVLALAEEYGADVESAFLLVLSQNLPRLLREERQKGEQELLAKLTANAATPGSLAAAAAPAVNLNSLNDNEFAAMVERVKRGELKSYK